MTKANVCESCAQCRIDRRRQKKVTNFQELHQRYIDDWHRFEQNNMGIHAVHRDRRFSEYLVWLGERTRLHLKPAWTQQDYAEIQSSDEGDNPYDEATRTGRQVEIAPVLSRAVSVPHNIPFLVHLKASGKLQELEYCFTGPGDHEDDNRARSCT